MRFISFQVLIASGKVAFMGGHWKEKFVQV